MNVYEAAALINNLKPGQWLSLEPSLFRMQAPPDWFPMKVRKIEDQILDNVIGSAYEIRFWIEPISGKYFFARLKEPLKDGWRTRVDQYQAPHFEQDVSGFWKPKKRT